MRSVPNLVWLKSFDCAARHMNFTAAAGELGITQTALSLHVRSLEAQLGCKLFTRAARRLTLTEIGQAYAFSVRRALGDTPTRARRTAKIKLRSLKKSMESNGKGCRFRAGITRQHEVPLDL